MTINAQHSNASGRAGPVAGPATSEGVSFDPSTEVLLPAKFVPPHLASRIRGGFLKISIASYLDGSWLTAGTASGAAQQASKNSGGESSAAARSRVAPVQSRADVATTGGSFPAPPLAGVGTGARGGSIPDYGGKWVNPVPLDSEANGGISQGGPVPGGSQSGGGGRLSGPGIPDFGGKWVNPRPMNPGDLGPDDGEIPPVVPPPPTGGGGSTGGGGVIGGPGVFTGPFTNREETETRVVTRERGKCLLTMQPGPNDKTKENFAGLRVYLGAATWHEGQIFPIRRELTSPDASAVSRKPNKGAEFTLPIRPGGSVTLAAWARSRFYVQQTCECTRACTYKHVIDSNTSTSWSVRADADSVGQPKGRFTSRHRDGGIIRAQSGLPPAGTPAERVRGEDESGGLITYDSQYVLYVPPPLDPGDSYHEMISLTVKDIDRPWAYDGQSGASFDISVSGSRTKEHPDRVLITMIIFASRSYRKVPGGPPKRYPDEFDAALAKPIDAGDCQCKREFDWTPSHGQIVPTGVFLGTKEHHFRAGYTYVDSFGIGDKQTLSMNCPPLDQDCDPPEPPPEFKPRDTGGNKMYEWKSNPFEVSFGIPERRLWGRGGEERTLVPRDTMLPAVIRSFMDRALVTDVVPERTSSGGDALSEEAKGSPGFAWRIPWFNTGSVNATVGIRVLDPKSGLPIGISPVIANVYLEPGPPPGAIVIFFSDSGFTLTPSDVIWDHVRHKVDSMFIEGNPSNEGVRDSVSSCMRRYSSLVTPTVATSQNADWWVVQYAKRVSETKVKMPDSSDPTDREVPEDQEDVPDYKAAGVRAYAEKRGSFAPQESVVGAMQAVISLRDSVYATGWAPPLIICGQGVGASSAAVVSRLLDQAGVAIDLMILVDPTPACVVSLTDGERAAMARLCDANDSESSYDNLEPYLNGMKPMVGGNVTRLVQIIPKKNLSHPVTWLSSPFRISGADASDADRQVRKWYVATGDARRSVFESIDSELTRLAERLLGKEEGGIPADPVLPGNAASKVISPGTEAFGPSRATIERVASDGSQFYRERRGALAEVTKLLARQPGIPSCPEDFVARELRRRGDDASGGSDLAPMPDRNK